MIGSLGAAEIYIYIGYGTTIVCRHLYVILVIAQIHGVQYLFEGFIYRLNSIYSLIYLEYRNLTAHYKLLK